MESKGKKSGAEVRELLHKLPEARVQITQAHLLTPEQAGWLEQVGLTIEQILSGYYSEDVSEKVDAIFAEWDAFLEEPYFSTTAVDPELVSAIKAIGEEQIVKQAASALTAKEKAAKANLTQVVNKHVGEDGKEYPVTPLTIQSHGWRRFAVEVVRLLDPVSYEQYKKLKYAQGQNPDLTTRREAYRFIIGKFLDLSYTIPGM